MVYVCPEFTVLRRNACSGFQEARLMEQQKVSVLVKVGGGGVR